MAKLLLVNPSTRKEAKMATQRKKPRTAAQKAATKRMIAANKAKRGGSRRARSAPAAAAPAPRRKRRASRSPSVIRKGQWPITSAAEASRAGRKLRRRRPNPIGGEFMQTLIPSAVGGGGALLLDVALGILPLPAQLKTGPMAPLVRVAGAVGLGMLASHVVSKRTANQIAAGALTVTMYDLAKSTLRKVAGNRIPGLGDDVGAYGVDGMGVYLDGQDDGVGDGMDLAESDDMGYIDSGMTVGELMPDGTVSGFETGVYR